MQDSNPLKLQPPRDWMAPTTLLPLATFLLHSASSVPNLSLRHALNKFHLREPHIPIPLFSTITLLLHALSFSPLLLHTSTNHPTITLRSSSKSSAYKRLGNPILQKAHSPPSSLHPYINWKAKGTWYTPPCLTPLSILNPHPHFILTQA